MIKYEIDQFVIAQAPTRVFDPSPTDISPQLGQIDAFGEEILRGVVRFFGDGTDLPPANVEDGVITLNCNLSQFPMVACLREEEKVAIYFKSVTDAGLTSGTDPFERTGPIRF